MDGMSHSVDQILAQTDKKTKIVPGHGPVATRSDLKDYREMLVQVRQRIEVLVGAGKTMVEAVAAAPTKAFDANWGRGYVSADVSLVENEPNERSSEDAAFTCFCTGACSCCGENRSSFASGGIGETWRDCYQEGYGTV